MAKKPIGLLLSDTHLYKDNIEQVDDIFNQAEEKANELGIDTIYKLGDIFESRKAQPLDVLNAFGNILRKSEIRKIVIPGNHDKVDYESEDSYLDEFRHHPNFILVRDLFYVQKGYIFLWLIPYFKEETVYTKYLDKVKEEVYKLNKKVNNIKHILLTHIAVNGVINNDKTEVKNELKLDLFKPFSKVFVGHYHNKSQIGNIYYIGSVAPKNFGENNDKGFVILYDDCSHEYIQAKFKEYHTIKIDINRTSQEELNELLARYKNNEHNIRFKFMGSIEKLKSIDINKFKSVGIDVKMDRPNVDEGIVAAKKQEFVSFNKESIKKEFDKFAEHNKLTDIEIGKNYLNKQLN